MSPSLPSFPGRLRRPEYTGPNRCLPCTAVNLALAVALGLVLAAVSVPLGVVAFGVALVLVYLRGYLVPGTPAMTKRYLPDRVLALFEGSPPASPVDPATVEGVPAVDPEGLLRSLDAVEPCETEDDLCLTGSFEAAWHDRLDDGRPDEPAVARMIGASDGAVTVRVADDAVSVTASEPGTEDDHDRRWRWPSVGALAADVAASDELRARFDDWGTLPMEQRLGILSALRMFLDRCPRCGGPIETGSEAVESCCRSWEVLAVTCVTCGERYLELDLEQLEPG